MIILVTGFTDIVPFIFGFPITLEEDAFHFWSHWFD